MGIVLVAVLVMVAAGILVLRKADTVGASTGTVTDDYVPMSAYDGRNDTTSDDRPSEPDRCSDAPDDSSWATCDTSSDNSDSSSTD